MDIVFIIISVILYLIGFVPYIYHVLHGRVVPHPFSWTIGAGFALMSGYIAYSEQGVSLALIVIIVRTFSLSIGAFLGWQHLRDISIGRLDYISIMLAGSLILLNHFLSTSLVVFFLILIDFLVLTPTLKKIWMYPVTEDALAWVMASLSGLCMLLTFDDLSFSKSGYFIYIASINLLVALMIYRRTLYLKHWYHALRNYFSNLALKKKL